MIRIDGKTAFKTIIDGLIVGMLSIGIFQSSTFEFPNDFAYLELSLLMLGILVLIAVYINKYGQDEGIIGIILVLGVSFLEIWIIGLILLESIQMIIVVFLIVSPSVLVFDKLLG